MRLPAGLVPAVLVSAVALAACGGDDDTAAIDTTPPTTAAGTTTTIAPDECFEVPEAATVPTTAPPTTAAPTTAPAPVVGPTLPPATTAPETTVPPTTVPPSTVPSTAPGTTTPGVEGEFPDRPPRAVRPCELPGGLQVTVLRPGEGRRAQTGDTLLIDYIGVRSEDGTVFDQSYTRGDPIEITLGTGSVIAGWDRGLAGVQQGALVRLDIPAELAYGDSPSGDIIQPGDALTFITEIRYVLAPVTAADAPRLAVPRSKGATEVTWQDAIVGDGPALEEGQTALINLMFVRGDNLVVLRSSWANNSPEQWVLDLPEEAPDPSAPRLIGLTEGLIGATVGTVRVITMPPEKAYGPEGYQGEGLPPATDLIVVVEVLGAWGGDD